MGEDMRETAVLHRVKDGYTTGARWLASRSMGGLARTRVTPNALTTAGVSLCLAASVVVFFENRNQWLFYWVGALLFVVGSILDILDGALARAGGKTTPFGAFLDSTTDRVGEGAMLGAIALIFHLRTVRLGLRGRRPRAPRPARPRADSRLREDRPGPRRPARGGPQRGDLARTRRRPRLRPPRRNPAALSVPPVRAGPRDHRA